MNKNKFVFMVKTFRNDFLALKRLLSTFQKFNRDGIKLFLVLPSDDAKEMLDTFPCELFVNTEVLHEEFFSCYTATTPVNGVRPGYVNQEIIKLAFHEICPAENFMPVDSDGEFLRDFYYSDFIASDGYPFSVLVEDNELKIDPEYWYEVGWLGRENNIRQIYDHIDFHPDIMLTAHGFCIMNVGVLSDLRKKFIEKKFGEFSPLNLFSVSGGTNVVTVKNTGGGVYSL